MAVAFVSSSSAPPQTGPTFSITKPPSAADGNWLVAFQETSISGGGTNPSAPSGWALLDRQAYSFSQYDLVCWIKQVSGDGSSYTFNNSSGGAMPSSNVYITCWSGAGAPTQITKNQSGISDSTAVGLTVTTVSANSYLAGAYAINSNVGTGISPSNLTNVLSTIGDATGKLSVAYDAQAAAGASGNKNATLSGNQAWGTLLVVIPPGATAPVADFTGTPTSGAASLSVAFTDSSTNTPTSWLWEKNSGSGWSNFAGTPTAQNPTESFAAGTWSVRLTATNAGGSNTKTRTDYVVSTAVPVAAFSGTPLSGTAPLSVAFTDASTNTPTSWLWQKNDGSGYVNFDSGATSQNPTEAFAAGTWDVKLTATNAGGSDAEEKLDYVTATDATSGDDTSGVSTGVSGLASSLSAF